MKHFASPTFWEAYGKLPALAVQVDEDLLWFWIGSHSDYDAIV